MPLFRPRVTVRRGPGLIGAAARTAVVAGTASAVAGGVRRRQEARAEQREAEQQALQGPGVQGSGVQGPAVQGSGVQGPAVQGSAVQGPAGGGSAQGPAIPEPRQEGGGLDDAGIARLQQLADLQKQGILTPEEFAAQKAAILGS